MLFVAVSGRVQKDSEAVRGPSSWLTSSASRCLMFNSFGRMGVGFKSCAVVNTLRACRAESTDLVGIMFGCFPSLFWMFLSGS